MKKYWQVYKMGLSRQLSYRMAFLLSQLRAVVVLIMLYYLWVILSKGTGSFASYSQAQLITYISLSTIIRALTYTMLSGKIAHEINDGTFAGYLVRPINHFVLSYFLELAERTVAVTLSIIEVVIFFMITGAHFFWQTDLLTITFFIILLILSHLLYFVMCYTVSLLAFWTRQAAGPKFLFEWSLVFTSGSYFPLNILPYAVFGVLAITPFIYISYIPIVTYLGELSLFRMIFFTMVCAGWLLIMLAVKRIVWRKGLKRFSAEGI
jgi:ABC-2 type transport system permease protein